LVKYILWKKNEDKPWIKLEFNVDGMLSWKNVDNIKIVGIGYESYDNADRFDFISYLKRHLMLGQVDPWKRH